MNSPLKIVVSPPFKGVKGDVLKALQLFVALFIFESTHAQQNPNPTLDTNMSGESHVIKGRDYIIFDAGFLYEIPANEPDKTFVAYFDYQELLLNIGGTLNSTSGFGISNTGAVGGTATSFDVGPSGAATYAIPLIVSPGTNEMEPNLSIVYNNQAPDGLLGKGFSLGGLSAITRGPATRYHDGQADQVDFDDQDRLLLDGERLILVSGNYGKAGSEYRLENDRMAKIEAFGSLGTSDWASHFVVQEKSGLKKTYGLNADAQMVAKVDGTNLGAYVWALVKVEDQASNYMTYEYLNDGTEYRLNKINYTGNTTTGLPTYASVQVEYEDRGTISRTGFIYGHPTELTKRIKNIKTYYGTNLIREYRLTYDIYDYMPHLTSVTEYNSAGEHYNAIQFDWNEENPGLKSESTSLPITLMNGELNQSQQTQELSGDFTGDGKVDLLVFYQFGAYNPAIDQNATYENWVLYEEVDGVMTQTFSGVDSRPQDTKYSGDFNGDGIADYLAISASNLASVFYGNGTGFESGFTQNLSTLKQFEWLQIGDFDGDGKSDLLVFKPYEYNNQNGQIIRFWVDILYNDQDVFISDKNANTFEWAFDIPDANPGFEFLVQDFNSDGITDLYSGLPLLQNNGSPIEKVMIESTSTRWNFIVENKSTWPDFTNELVRGTTTMGDFNGDGLFDLLNTNNSVQFQASDGNTYWGYNWLLHLGNGNGFEDGVEVKSPSLWPTHPASVLDLNGDGKSDLLSKKDVVIAGFPEYNILSFQGANLGQVLLAELDVAAFDNPLLIGDFTGNGFSDLLELGEVLVMHDNTVVCGSGATPPTCEQYRYSRSSTLHADYHDAPTMVSAIANSYGSRLYLDYLPLTDSEVYTKYQTFEPGNSDNLLDAQFPMHVVRTVYADNGLGSLAETRYHYEGAVVHRFGKGYLGFQQIVVQDITQSIETTQSYDIDTSHFVPLLTNTVSKSLITGGKISSTSTVYTNLKAPATDMYLFAKSSETVNTFDIYDDTEALTSMTTDYTTYDSYGNIEQMSVTYGSGHQTLTQNTYDYGGVANWILGKLSSASVTKSAPGQANSVRSSSFTYDSKWFLKTETIQPGHELELVTTYTYDDFGNILTSTTTGVGDDPGLGGNAGTDQSRFIHFTFDDKGRFVESEANALTHSSSRTYDHTFGNLLTETGPNGLTTSYTYDNFGRLYQVTAPNTNIVATTSYGWVTGGGEAPDHARYYVDEMTSGSPSVRTYYDRLNRPLRTRTTNWANQVVYADTHYDGQGRAFQASDPYFSGDQPLWATQNFDPIGRVTRIETPGNRVTENTYTGLITTTRNAKGQETTAQVNMLGQQIKATDAKGNSLDYTYHASGTLASISDFDGNTTAFTYDVLGNRTQVNDPDLGIIHTRHNAFGEVVWQKSARNYETTFTYDVLGRTSERKIKKGSDEEITTWVFDTRKKGLLTSSTAGNISKEYFYDTYLRPTQIRETLEGQAYDIFQTYDGYGRLVDLTYPSGFAIQHHYTTEGYQEKVTSTDGTTTYWQITQENARGQLEAFSLANGTFQTHRSFQKTTGLLSQIVTQKGNDKLQNLYYEFDALNNLTKRTNYLADGGRGLEEKFTYDNLNRLKTASITGKAYGQLVMDYDDLGNITSKSDVGTYKYDGSKPHAVSEMTQNGTAIPIIAQDITYSGFEKVRTVTEGDASIHFTYGVDHERKITTTTVAGVHFTKRFIGGLYEEEENHSGDKRKLHYIQAGGEAIAIYTEDEGQSTQTTHYLLKDHLGSLAAIADANGNVIERYSYDAWGKRRDADTWDDLDGATDVSYVRGFTGHEHLELFALVNMNGRMYDPVLGRFLSADPYTQAPDFTQGLNRYSYVFNNPLSFTDPSGYITIGQVAGTVLQIGITAALSATPLAPVAPFIAGFLGQFYGAYIDGASFNQALVAGLKGGAIAQVTAGISAGVGTSIDPLKSFWGKELLRAHLHGISNGLIRQGLGGKFWHGYASGAISSYAGGLSQRWNLDVVGGTIVSAVAGGASEAISGGNFQDGAITGAYTYLFNHAAHEATDPFNKAKRQANKFYGDENQPIPLGPLTASMGDGTVYFEGVRIYASEVGDLKYGAAFTLPGVGIFVNPRDVYNLDLLRHEFGHVLQAREWGMAFFYGTVVPVSLESTQNGFRHQETWTEWYANKLSYEYFGRPTDWNMTRYRISPNYSNFRRGMLPPPWFNH